MIDAGEKFIAFWRHYKKLKIGIFLSPNDPPKLFPTPVEPAI